MHTQAKNTENALSKDLKALHEGTMEDWMLHDGIPEEVPEANRTRYQVKIEAYGKTGNQIAIKMVAEDDPEGKPALDLFVEVNRGKPCLHVGNIAGADMVVSLFMDKDGVVAVPNLSHCRAEHISSERYYPGDKSTNALLFPNKADEENP